MVNAVASWCVKPCGPFFILFLCFSLLHCNAVVKLDFTLVDMYLLCTHVWPGLHLFPFRPDGIVGTQIFHWNQHASSVMHFLRLCFDIPVLMYPTVFGFHLAEELLIGHEWVQIITKEFWSQILIHFPTIPSLSTYFRIWNMMHNLTIVMFGKMYQNDSALPIFSILTILWYIFYQTYCLLPVIVVFLLRSIYLHLTEVSQTLDLLLEITWYTWCGKLDVTRPNSQNSRSSKMVCSSAALIHLHNSVCVTVELHKERVVCLKNFQLERNCYTVRLFLNNLHFPIIAQSKK